MAGGKMENVRVSRVLYITRELKSSYTMSNRGETLAIGYINLKKEVKHSFKKE
jgi:hypothetical protein